VGPLLHVGAVNALAAGLLALAAVAAGRWSRRPAVVHGLWVLVLLKLVTPPLISLPWLAPAEEPAPRPALPAPPEPAVALAADPAPEAPAAPPGRFANLDELKAAAREEETLLPPAPAPEVGVPG
jgi:bla regulator protein BlaR1